ncbi:galactokinase [Lactococcus fujiensis]|uniref:Galactokinase n=1 Tax=Lactococcus fujiensis JCM 16395 TaxID=1291764 RepID=A0A2A5RPM3_9LACT|nr:galactokinase [Lactococcus fujiensis]PCS01395.1 galactokinase [Lactococcus fujiensis JCM 16395]
MSIVVENSTNLSAMTAKFTEVFGDSKNLAYFFSPGRINLIGEHTDYNGGYVFPASITIGTTGLARLRQDQKVRLYSLNFSDLGVIEFDLADADKKDEDRWSNYVKGMITMLQGAGYSINQGFELLVNGEIPTASGLSSSASLELLVGVVLDDLFKLNVPRLELVQLGQKTENDFIGVNSGILDQFAIGFGQINQAILLDCNTLKYEMVPVELGDYDIVIMNTNKPRALTESKYNERFAETREALKRMQSKLNINALAELSNETFDANAHLIGDETLIKRARHAVYENNRTIVAQKAFVAGDLEKFGQLLNDSHASLKNDYEVTGIELDTLAETAQQQDGVLGSRMTGAGFGGCAIALVKHDQIDAFEKAVGDRYETVVGYPASFYVAQIGSGATKLDID